jgi:hypothetical protein
VIPADDPLAATAGAAVEAGDVEALRRLLAERPELATERFGDERMSRTLLHAVVDWPGHRPNTVEMIEVILAAGADVDGRFAGPHDETALHWAASNDDVAALDALLDAGADIEARGAVIGGGTALTDATAFGQWNAARRLLERGAVAGRFESAAMGLLERVLEHIDGPDGPDGPSGSVDRHGMLWGAAHGGHLPVVELLVERGAAPAWAGWDDLTPLGAARRSAGAGVPGADAVVAYLAPRLPA